MPGHIENNQSERNQEYEQYRKKFNRLIICRDCTRSFDAKEDGRIGSESVTLCKFCNSNNIIIKGRHIFKYYCPTCEKSYISEEKQTKCKNCNTEYLHMRRITDLSKDDRLEVRKEKIRQMLEKLRSSRKKKGQTNVRPQRRPLSFPLFSSKEKKAAKKKKKPISFHSRRKKEEMPTY